MQTQDNLIMIITFDKHMEEFSLQNPQSDQSGQGTNYKFPEIEAVFPTWRR